MGYDVAFWKEGAKCKFSAHAIYRRLRRGLPVEGLQQLPRQTAELAVRGLFQECRQDGNFFEGLLEGARVEIAVLDNAILADFPIAGFHFPELLAEAFARLGVSLYDPVAVRAPSGDHLYDDDYAEVSRDPDLGYWVEVSLAATPIRQFGERVPVGGQTVNEIEYVFFKISPGTDVFAFHGLFREGKASIAADRLNGGSLDGYANFAAVVIVPASIVQRYAEEFEPREHVRLFTAFADDDKVLYHQTWWPNDSGLCATVISLPAIPRRMKTVVSTRFVHRG